MVEPIFDYQFRLILIGDSTVGKSSLLKYFTDGKFAEVIHYYLFIYSLKLNVETCPNTVIYRFQTPQLVWIFLRG